MEKIVIFGAGKISSALLSLHKAHQDVFDDVIVGIIDNDIDKRGNYLYDYMIYSPDELPNISYDYVVIACNFYEEVVRQLEKDYSVSLEKILNYTAYKGKKISAYQFRRNSEHNKLCSSKQWTEFNPESTVVYTSITGNYDDLRLPAVVNPKLKYVCFTDNKNLRSDIWNVKYVENMDNLDNALFARQFKIRPHRFFPEYDTSIWIDANLQIKKDLMPLMQRYQQNADILLFPHPERMCIYDEGATCIHWRKDDKKRILYQMKKYLDEQYPCDNGLMCGGCIVRNHNKSNIIDAMENWWSEVINGSRRDQISLPYALWKTENLYDLSDLNYDNNEWFRVLPHKK